MRRHEFNFKTSEMKNRLTELFIKKQNNILNIFFTCGHPNLEDTGVILRSLQDSGADMVEIGMPYSDPLADGPVIQQSSSRALKNGMSLDLLFSQVRAARDSVSMPIVLMGYYNQLLQYGEEKFFLDCVSCGIDGLIIPDLPYDIYEDQYKETMEQLGISICFLITPQTSKERIQKIDKLSSGFVYIVATNSTTGNNKGFTESNLSYFESIQRLKLKSPALIGFGISEKRMFDQVCNFSNGGIIGSAFIRAIDNKTTDELPETINTFITSILQS